MFPRALIGLLALAVVGCALADARQDLRTAYEHNLSSRHRPLPGTIAPWASR